MQAIQLLSPKSFASLLDISLSMLYKLRKEDTTFPFPAVKLFQESDRGCRWTEQQVAEYIALKNPRLMEMQEEETAAAPRFKRIRLKNGKIAA